MHYAFQDRENLFILMDYLGGGDLRYHISRQKKFTEKQSSINKNLLNIMLLKYYNKFFFNNFLLYFNFRIFYMLFTSRLRMFTF